MESSGTSRTTVLELLSLFPSLTLSRACLFAAASDSFAVVNRRWSNSSDALGNVRIYTSTRRKVCSVAGDIVAHAASSGELGLDVKERDDFPKVWTGLENR